MHTSVGKTPSHHKAQEYQKEKNCCYITACWIFQVLCWITLIPIIVLYFNKKEISQIILISFGLSYIIYIFLEFCSKTGKYLCNINSGGGIYQKMGTYFQTPPLINLHCECYHYESRIKNTTDSEGKRRIEKSRTKVTTHKETYKLSYYSVRDISGLFCLNCDKAYAHKKQYIKLKLKEEINFADAISYYDYKRVRADFFKRNRFRDVHFAFSESRKIPGMKNQILVKLHSKGNCMINFFWFFIFTIFTFAEFYRLYVESCFIYQKFKIKKLVSTRYDLNQPVYQELVPKIDLISQQYQYEQEYYNYKNEDYDLKKPTKEELEEAKQYRNKVPNNQISNGEEQSQQDVIEENPEYEYDYNPNEIPDDETDSNNISLGKEQLSDSGDIQPDNDKPEFRISSKEKLIISEDWNSERETGYNPKED